VKKGSSEVYLKNEHALQTYIVDNALNGAILKSKAGDRSGADFLDFVGKLTKFSTLITGLSRFIPADIAENLALAGVFDKDWMGEDSKTKALLTKIEKLFHINCDDEIKWSAAVTDDQDIEMIKETRGVKSSYFAKKSHFDLPEAVAIAQVKELYPNEWLAWVSSTGATAGTSGESYDDVAARSDLALSNLALEHPGKSIIVVTHNYVIRTLVASVLGASIESVYHLDIQPCSITTVNTWASDGLRALRSMSERSHLK
jgi:hypothetical protein